jgi:hypothetical protein
MRRRKHRHVLDFTDRPVWEPMGQGHVIILCILILGALAGFVWACVRALQ